MTWKKATAILMTIALFMISAQVLERKRTFSSHRLDSLPRFHTQTLAFFSVGHAALVSDLLMARTLSYLGANRHRTDRAAFEGILEIFVQAIEMDPNNRELILFAANTLAEIDFRAAIRLLGLGRLYHPGYWKFPELAGFLYFYYAHDPVIAARMYEQAARFPGHPPFVPSIASKLYEESGNFRQAVLVLQNLASGSVDRKVRQGFEARLQQIQERVRLRRFRVPVDLLAVLSATRLQVQMRRFNPYSELDSTLLIELTAPKPSLDLCQQAIVASVWRNWLGKELWMQLQTDEEGQLLQTDLVFKGCLLSENGDDLTMRILQQIDSCPTLFSGSNWSEYTGRVVRICGHLQNLQANGNGIELCWNEADLPPAWIAAVDQEMFAVGNGQSWLDVTGLSLQAITALLVVNADNHTGLALLHPAQITRCTAIR